jgi:hypothetical protein
MALPLLIENPPAVLANFSDISLVYLFGSRVMAQIGSVSDCNLAIHAWYLPGTALTMPRPLNWRGNELAGFF